MHQKSSAEVKWESKQANKKTTEDYFLLEKAKKHTAEDDGIFKNIFYQYGFHNFIGIMYSF